ncbi:MAG: tetratricopeptide repeat protein, partial [Bacteroidales bacterium]|nr:tetratricopeptide repeat protein [Bacteroidales bacterium]
EDFEKALDYYQEALRKRTGVDDRQLTGSTYNGIGSVYLSYKKDYAQAIQYYDRAEVLREEIGDLAGLRATRLYKATAYMNSADNLSNSARYPEALVHLEKALDLNKKINANVRVGETLNQIGLIYSRMGDFSTAVEKLSEAAEIMKDEENETGLAGVYNHFGIVLQAAGRIERALEYYRMAFEIYEVQNDPEGLLPVISNMGTLFFDMKDFSRAEEFHLRGLKISREIGSGGSEVNYLLNLANDYTALERLDEAMLNYRSANEIVSRLNNPDLLWRIAVSMAENYEQRGDLENAVALNDSALNIIEGIRNSLQDKELKAYYIASYRSVFEDIINLLGILHGTDAEKGYDYLAFNYAENCKSRVLLDLLAESLSAGKSNVEISGPDASRPAIPVSATEVQSLLPDENSVILEYSVGDTVPASGRFPDPVSGFSGCPDGKPFRNRLKPSGLHCWTLNKVHSNFFQAPHLYCMMSLSGRQSRFSQNDPD